MMVTLTTYYTLNWKALLKHRLNTSSIFCIAVKNLLLTSKFFCIAEMVFVLALLQRFFTFLQERSSVNRDTFSSAVSQARLTRSHTRLHIKELTIAMAMVVVCTFPPKKMSSWSHRLQIWVISVTLIIPKVVDSFTQSFSWIKIGQ